MPESVKSVQGPEGMRIRRGMVDPSLRCPGMCLEVLLPTDKERGALDLAPEKALRFVMYWGEAEGERDERAWVAMSIESARALTKAIGQAIEAYQAITAKGSN